MTVFQVLLGAAGILFGGTTVASENGFQTPHPLIERVHKKDWNVIPEMKRAGGVVIDDLVRLSSSRDVEIRELALWCLDEIGGERARQVFLMSLRDAREDIRDRAVNFLHHHHAKNDLPELFNQLENNSDDYIRKEVALVIGEVEDIQAVPQLRKFVLRPEPKPVSHAIQLALARLGDARSQELTFEGLKSREVSQIRTALDDFKYVNTPEGAVMALPLLSDRRDAMNIAPSGGEPILVRVCDLAIHALDVVLARPFQFSTHALRRYTDQELEAARQFVLRTLR